MRYDSLHWKQYLVIGMLIIIVISFSCCFTNDEEKKKDNNGDNGDNGGNGNNNTTTESPVKLLEVRQEPEQAIMGGPVDIIAKIESKNPIMDNDVVITITVCRGTVCEQPITKTMIKKVGSNEYIYHFDVPIDEPGKLSVKYKIKATDSLDNTNSDYDVEHELIISD